MKDLVLLVAAFATACATAPSPAPPEEPREAPWARHAPLAAAEAPEVLVREWSRAENRETCAPLAFDPAAVDDAATPRRANFSGGWAVAYDRPGWPGSDAGGRDCASCGRSAFGLAGTGAEHGGGEGMYGGWENARTWQGGGYASWGLEGGTGPGWLAYVVVPGERCLYNVWSHLSREHLEELIAALRRVEVP